MLRQIFMPFLVLVAMATAPFGLKAAGEQPSTDVKTSQTTQNQNELSALTPTPLPAAAKKDAIKVLADLHHANLMEIQMGKLAMKNGQSEAVQEYGEKLVRDHQELDDKTKQLAKGLDITLLDDEKIINQKNHQAMEQLKAKKGNEFDRSFAQMMVTDHKKNIQKLQNAQTKLSGTSVGSLVTQILPVLQDHERAASELLAQIGTSENPS